MKVLHSFYHSPIVIRMIKSRRFKWVGHITRMEDSRSAFTILRDNPAERDC